MSGRQSFRPRPGVLRGGVRLAPLAVALVLGLAGCGGGSKDESKGGETAAQSTPAPGGASLSPSLSAQESQAKQQAAEESAAAAEEAARERKEAAEAGH